MRARVVCIFLIASILTMVAVSAFAAASYRVTERQSTFQIRGFASSIDRLREYLEITDRGSTYTILTGRASITLDTGRPGTTQDLRDNVYIEITGEQLSARSILAASVVVLDERSAPRIPADSYRPNDHIESTGSVTNVITAAREVDVRTDDGNFALVLRPDTVIRRYIYVTDLNDINEGDDVSFTGRMGQDGRIIAERIQVSAATHKATSGGAKSYHPTYLSAVSHSREDAIEGRIISPPSSFDRALALDTEYGERKVDVLKSAEVRIDRLPASIHDLAKGDHIRVFGTWDGDTMVATRVETYAPSSSATYRVQELPLPEPAPEPAPAPEPQAPPQPSNPPAGVNPAPAEPAPAAPTPAAPANPSGPEPAKATAITGRIIAIDYTNLDLTVDAEMKDNKIDARDAVVTRQGSTRRFSELKKGDKVEIKGDWNGDVMKAISIDVVE